MGSRTFVFHMKPGHTYVVKVEFQEGMGSSVRMLVYGIEQDQTGRDALRVEAATSEQEVRACLASGSG